MGSATRLLAPLAWLGRQGAWPLGICLAGGFALPMLAEPLRPLLAPLVVALLALGFARVPASALGEAARRPRFLVSSILWLVVALPLLAALVVRASGLAASSPDLGTIIVAGLGSSPVVSMPAYAVMLGLPSGAVLALLVGAMTVLPVTLPLVLWLAFGGASGLEVDALWLALRLAGLLLAAGALGLAIRWLTGPARLAKNAAIFDGLAHVLLFLLAIVLVGSLTADLIARPGATLLLAGLCCLVAASAMGLTALASHALPGVRAEDRAGLCLAAGVRNLALVLAAVPGLGPDAIAYVGAVQVPIYLAPLVLGTVSKARLDRTVRP